MKVKLLKKLRREIINNSEILWYSNWSGCLKTVLKGKAYYGRDHSALGFSLNPEMIGKELEHKALKGYLQDKRSK